jgi:hypothetical protein
LAEDDTDCGIHHLLIRRKRRLWRVRLPALLQPQARPVAHPGYRGRTTGAH